MSPTRFSIIIPVFNGERYASRMIERVLRQTYEDFELILVDDGSSDASGEAIDRYDELDSRVRVLHTRNRGASAARNSGMELATGDYQLIWDCDDDVSPDALERIARVVERDAPDVIRYNFATMRGGGTT